METKEQMRKQMRDLAKNFSAAERNNISKILSERLIKSEFFAAAQTILLYWPMFGEVDLWPVHEAAINMGKTVCYPKVVSVNPCELQIVQTTSLAILELAYDALNAPYPKDVTPLSCIAQVDLVVVPGVAFDLSGKRIGMGKGCYDRFLPLLSSSCKLFAACFPYQLVPEVPSEQHDQTIQYLVVKEGILSVKDNKTS